MSLLHKTKQQYNHYHGNKVGLSAVSFAPLRSTKGCRLYPSCKTAPQTKTQFNSKKPQFFSIFEIQNPTKKTIYASNTPHAYKKFPHNT
jgi:hypothetical protein